MKTDKQEVDFKFSLQHQIYAKVIIHFTEVSIMGDMYINDYFTWNWK